MDSGLFQESFCERGKIYGGEETTAPLQPSDMHALFSLTN